MRTLILVVLGIVLIISVYFLYKYAIRENRPLEKINLSGSTSINEPSMDGDTSSVGYYTFWLYVNSWDSKINEKTILNKIGLTGSSIHLYMPAQSPHLICKVITTTTTPPTPPTTTILHRSFPLQRWTHVILAFDSNVMDCYVDGKLVTSAPLPEVISMENGTANRLGGSGADMFMSGFIKKNIRATHETVQSEYSKSKLMMQSELPDYNVDVSLIKNGEVAKQFTLL